MSTDSSKTGTPPLNGESGTGKDSSQPTTIAAAVARFGRRGDHRQTSSRIGGSSGSIARRAFSADAAKLAIVPSQAVLGSSARHYEELKANFLARHAKQPTRVILFSGVVNGDGASSTASNFALTLAQDPELKILLIDANLRNPSLHYTFSINHNHTSSLSKLLEEAEPGHGPVCFEQGKLSVLPAGGVYSDPTSIFASQQFAKFIQAMQQVFDFIVLDGPSVFGSSETRLLASIADATILVIHSGKTRKQIAHRAIRELEAGGGNVLGTVLNRRKYYIPDWLYKWL